MITPIPTISIVSVLVLELLCLLMVEARQVTAAANPTKLDTGSPVRQDTTVADRRQFGEGSSHLKTAAVLAAETPLANRVTIRDAPARVGLVAGPPSHSP